MLLSCCLNITSPLPVVQQRMPSGMIGDNNTFNPGFGSAGIEGSLRNHQFGAQACHQGALVTRYLTWLTFCLRSLTWREQKQQNMSPG
jgi:hypothetical protein